MLCVCFILRQVPRDPDTNEFTLMTPQGVCGKRNYISPEVVQNARPFNGFAIDMWAAGVILFIMLTGVPPVDIASELDPRFRMIREGQLPALLAQWNFHLSPEAVGTFFPLLSFALFRCADDLLPRLAANRPTVSPPAARLDPPVHARRRASARVDQQALIGRTRPLLNKRRIFRPA